jgi:hypothetical protein
VPGLLTLALTIDIYRDPEFEFVTGFMEYSAFTNKYKSLQYVNLIVGLLIIVDAIVLIADKHKRSLHDKIGQTYVIDQSQPISYNS